MKYSTKTAIAACLFTVACAPLQLYYKEGETVARMDRDETRCEVTALRQVPTDIRTRYIPPQYQHYKVCHGTGYCSWHRRLISPGRHESYDANLPLRARVTEQCMADKGYVRTKIKRCDAATTEATTLRATQVLPPVSEKSCAIRLKSGRWQIVTPDT
ncbi:hypothetical protein AAFO92_22025 [Roseovarius sp. CAU 1744]|uniref:hypothetical protein n=1 Tax=Roseovarius sp. CAU 1744 TaxID=3140368 RepID=UPI00325B8253